jgi:methanogenic corrinoid protein MtbC1
MAIMKSIGEDPADPGKRDRSTLSAAHPSPDPLPDGELDPERLARLMRTIEGEIVPRLIMSRKLQAATALPEDTYGEPLDDIDVKEFVRLLLAHEPGIASAYVDTVRSRGTTLRAIHVDLLAPAARELGLLWEAGECDFMQVTVGLCRLHQVLRELNPVRERDACPEADGRGILLAAYPGEPHTIGLTLAADFLCRAGWRVSEESPATVADLLLLTRQNFFAVVGLLVGSAQTREELAATIRSIREQSRNRKIGVIVGGPCFVANPELAACIGADATASNGCDAAHEAERLSRSSRWQF